MPNPARPHPTGATPEPPQGDPPGTEPRRPPRPTATATTPPPTAPAATTPLAAPEDSTEATEAIGPARTPIERGSRGGAPGRRWPAGSPLSWCSPSA